MGFTPSRFALRGQPFGCPNSFRAESVAIGVVERRPRWGIRPACRLGLLVPSMGLAPSGPASGCPNSFQTILVLVPSMGLAPSGPASGFPIRSKRFSARPIHGTRPFGASLRLSKFVPDDFSAHPIHGGHPFALCAAGQPFGCPNSFLTLRRQDAEANVAEGDGPEGEGRDQPESICRTERVPLTLSLRQTQKRPFRGAFVSGGERGIRTLDRAINPILP